MVIFACQKYLWIIQFSNLLVQLAGVVAVEVTGGPTVEFVPGRRVF